MIDLDLPRLIDLCALPAQSGQTPEFGVMVTPTHTHRHIGELPVSWLRMLVHSHQLVVLRDFDNFDSTDSFARYCSTFGQIMMWPFGAVLELEEHPDPDDHIFANSYVPLHWDGMYLDTVPEFQIFQCVNAVDADQGGRTTFSNTAHALRIASPQVRELWSKAYGSYQRTVELYSNTAHAPIIDVHPRRQFPVLRFCEQPVKGDGSFINPSRYTFSGIEAGEEASLLDSLKTILYDPRVHYSHQWRTGDIVLTDNFTLLHGREAFTSHSGRHLRRVHIHSDPPLSNPHVHRPEANAAPSAPL
ncbi:TauD/TfdA family dioxygenase [Pseudomonas sp. F8002]|uniref:TauD/TfdA dioxygenase family protein n=1 Tax=Pseudomonas sp. F8002 TaxID=2738822 RepID=UPI00159FA294|nr:TauD/TfdA family dioxygenase [Pseudomonas sp. F8002]NWB56115.1 TauD/TfdA family dioxygenase [Pseudomonas sp. F8002]